jgi:hypothetical protein
MGSLYRHPRLIFECSPHLTLQIYGPPALSQRQRALRVTGARGRPQTMYIRNGVSNGGNPHGRNYRVVKWGRKPKTLDANTAK